MVRTWSRLRKRALSAAAKGEKDAGFTLVELAATFVVMGIVATTVTAGVSIGMRTMMSVGEIAASESRAANAVADITENVTLATPILAISRNRIVMLRDLPGRCERHQYVVGSSMNNTPRNLQHTIQRYRTAPGTDCASVAPAAWSGIPTILDTVVVDNLVANPDGTPIFTYSAPGALNIPLPGDSNYDPAKTPYGPCDISQVTITLSVQPTTEDMVQTIRSTASPRSYGLGLRC